MKLATSGSWWALTASAKRAYCDPGLAQLGVSGQIVHAQTRLYLGHAPALKKNLSALDNLRCHPASDILASDDMIFSALASLNLAGYEERPVGSLSAGQQRRVALTRLLLSQAPLWLLDEPFTALDVSGCEWLDTQIRSHVSSGGAVVYTSHQPSRLGPCSKMSIWSAMSADIPLLSLREAFSRQFRRHFKALMGSPADMANPLLFFFMVVTLFPLGLGPDPERLSAMAPGLLWVVALLSSLMVSSKLFGSDYEDGSLEQLAIAPYPLSVLVMGEIAAHWLAAGFLLAVVSPLFGIMLGLPAAGLGVLFYSLILGTICLTLIGAIGSALTVSIRRGGLLMSLLIIPLNVPVLIFGTTAVSEAVIGGNPQTWLTLLGGLAMGSLALVPLAISAALRVSLDN